MAEWRLKQSRNLNNEDEDEFDEQLAQLEHEERVVGPTDLYAVLNLDRDASEDDIKNAYRRLSMTFHPDKHHTPEDKERAQIQFQAIKKAYDVLSNPNRRHIYNTFGAEGLRTNWDVSSQRAQTAQQAREEFERQQRQRLETEAERLVKSKGEVHIGLDAVGCFDGGRRRPFRKAAQKGLLDAVVLPEISHAFVKHSWETKLLDSTDLTIQGSVMAKNGVGAGTVAATVRHVIDPMTWTESTFQATMKNPSASFKLVKNFTNDVFTSVQATVATLESPPPLAFVAGRKLDSKHTGYLTFRTGDYAIGPWGDVAGNQRAGSACGLGIVGRSLKGQWSCELSMGLNSSSINFGLFRSIGWGIRARAGVALGTGIGLSTSVSADKKISKLDRVGMSVEAASAGGVSFKLRFMRLGQKFVLPIQLAPQLDLRMAAFAVVIPLCTAVALDRLVLEPNRRNRLATRLAKLREDNAALIEQRKQEAISAIQLMTPQVARKREAEEAKDGLIIVEAIYGKLPVSKFPRNSHGGRFSFKGVFEKEQSGITTPPHMIGRDNSFEEVEEPEIKWIDVTIPVQGLVFNSQLYISGSHSKAHIVGFYDPCIGESKKLRVTYRFQGKLHQVEVEDGAAVAAPLRAHTVSEL
ncbi:DnaJ-domain-containing protein [Rhizoclosmatium globosum]|uniref:DnaJ-domain-containing protein n=1 Tax=Rhizoclosmatium globosum TaxID=329046 RepID=A0A1Y2CPT3_9FUNG|nr:DnaJ-domain-containing protein [Rhizoclosmatium globosum]|eukprot:ORY49039.1 DnaJ-domain-containing protein [Rhizoclosmatium globosum]